MIFENPQVDVAQLPQIDMVAFKKLAPTYKATEYIGTGILYTVLLAGAIALYFKASPILGTYRLGIFAAWALLFLTSMLLVSKKYNMAGYALREHDVIHKHGVWWHTVTAIPFNRMQHCEISQGPVQNAFGLATLRIFTAGGANSDLSIDGLEQEEAKRIKDFITAKISGHLEVNSMEDNVEPAAPVGDQTTNSDYAPI